VVKLTKALNDLRSFRVLVLGDFLLDTYTTGKIRRISPEAPVPVMEVLRQESRPGGAGNVVLNLLTLGAKVFALGRIGDDEEGEELKRRLGEANTSGMVIEKGYRTPIKNRLIADSQQLIRIDFEKITPIPSTLEERVIQKLEEILPQVDIVAISDYGKGFLTEKVLRACFAKGVPTIVDPKGADFTKYRGATLIKPNLSEAYAAAKLGPQASLDEVAKKLEDLTEILLITRSEAGISVFQKGERADFPVRSKEVKDVTGAGDTVLSMICLGLANGLDIHQAAQLANIAAGLSIERVGCVQITMAELAQRLLEIDSDTKVFDENHTYALQQVLKGKKVSLLVLDKGQEMTNGLFKTIRKLSNEAELVIYVRDSQPDDEFIHLLSSLHEVGAIILQKESLKNLSEAIQPDEVFVMKQDKAARELLDSLISPLRSEIAF
jgi:D-beta-D-heptose 7-phosphate kinase/D-beta-D-heptose 1-phosphate adenosyltransferase